MRPYSEFMPRLAKWMDELGFNRQLLMPSRAFCSDETQGPPTIHIKRQFGIFPFDHGVVGGLLAADRHGPHSHHGEDLLIVQASHVGLDEATGTYGMCRRVKTVNGDHGPTCGKLAGVIAPFIDSYHLASKTTLCTVNDADEVTIDVDTQFLDQHRQLGTVLKFQDIFKYIGDTIQPPKKVSSVRAAYQASDEFAAHLLSSKKAETGGEVVRNTPFPIGHSLTPKFFRCVYNQQAPDEPHGTIIANILPTMPVIVSGDAPPLLAAVANAQAEFETSYRSVSSSPIYRDRNFFYIAGINVDISPTAEAAKAHRSEFMRTYFVPWAAYYHTRSGERCLIEQPELFEKLESFAEATRHESEQRELSLFRQDPHRYGV